MTGATQVAEADGDTEDEADDDDEVSALELKGYELDCPAVAQLLQAALEDGATFSCAHACKRARSYISRDHDPWAAVESSERDSPSSARAFASDCRMLCAET